MSYRRDDGRAGFGGGFGGRSEWNGFGGRDRGGGFGGRSEGGFGGKDQMEETWRLNVCPHQESLGWMDDEDDMMDGRFLFSVSNGDTLKFICCVADGTLEIQKVKIQ